MILCNACNEDDCYNLDKYANKGVYVCCEDDDQLELEDYCRSCKKQYGDE